VGATERSPTAHALVQRLLDELDRSGIEWPVGEVKEDEEPKRDFNSLCNRLRQRLGDYAGVRRIVILLDALNQLTDGHDLDWLPGRLGPSVRIVVSCVEDSAGGPRSVMAETSTTTDMRERVPPEQQFLRSLASRQPAPLRVPLGPLTEDDVRTIVVEFLKEYCKELDREHVNAICRMDQAKNPLYLLVMLGELRTLGGNDMNHIVGERIAALPRNFPDTVSLFRWVLQRLEVFGRDAVRWWCLYSAYGRVGMAGHELADLLSRKLNPDAGSIALRIERGLRRYLQRRGGQLDFFHTQLRQAVFDQYRLAVEPTPCHSDIANYFRDLADPENNRSWKGNNPRPFLQMAFHLANAGAQRLNILCQTLCDLRFVEARCRFGQVFELIADYRLALEHLPEAQAELAEERLRQERAAKWMRGIIEYARQWNKRHDKQERRRKNTGAASSLPEMISSVSQWSDTRIQAECKRIISNSTRLDRLNAFFGFAQRECYTLLEHGEWPTFVVQHALNDAPAGPVHDEARRLSSEAQDPLLIRRWQSAAAYNPCPALSRILSGHRDFVECVSVTPDGRRAVSGSGDNFGSDLTVRVWNLETGACLRTLAGHSRQVASVSVTPDGRRAVSGSWDQTLRVWNVENGTCVRTFDRHSGQVHDVSVTLDGRCAVTFEHVMMAPDRWRAVSQSREHSRRVWDLESGACLRTLEGHSDSITSVSVTPDGRRAVSGSADHTLRVWDLKRKFQGVFAPKSS
jgi:hypothetical protein